MTRRLTDFHGLAAAAALVIFTSACGGSQSAAPATPPAATGSSSGHIDLFRWAPVDGATGYRMRLTATTDGRTIWESPVLTQTEAHLPNTVALEPEGYVWTVTALKGDTVVATSPASRFTVTP
jgi:hypothetical protein